MTTSDISDLVRRLRDMEPDDDQLRESLKVNGWVAELSAIADEHGVVLVGNRRMRLARELGIEPVIRKVEFGAGSEADIFRVRLATVSNIGGVAMTQKERKRLAEHLYKLEWTMQNIADALGVSQRTISSDLGNLEVTSKSKHAVTKSNPKGAGRPKGSGKSKGKDKVASGTDNHIKARDAVRPYVEMGQLVPVAKLAKQLGVHVSTVDIARRVELGVREALAAGGGKSTEPKPVPPWKNLQIGVSPSRELTGKPGPGASIEEINAFDEEYGRTPLHPKIVTDLTRAARRVSSLTECVSGVERADRPDVDAFFAAVDAMLAYVPDKTQTDGRETDYASDARKQLARVRKALPGALMKLHDLETRLRQRDADKIRPLSRPSVEETASEIMRPAWVGAGS